MKTAVIGSRNINISKDKLLKYIPDDQNIKLTEFLPQYDLYKKGAPLMRNIKIIEYCDRVVALWDGRSKGTKFVIDKCKELNKPITIYLFGI